MDLTNNYYYFKNALKPEICDSIIQLGLSSVTETAQTTGNMEKGEDKIIPYNDKSTEEIIKKYKNEGLSENQIYEKLKKENFIRDSKVSWLYEKWIYDNLWPFVDEANLKSGWSFDVDYAEPCQFTIYEPNSFYGWHTDGGSDNHNTYKRKIPGLDTIKNIDQKGIVKYVENPNMVGKVRKISMTINLSNESEYTGGDLKFDFGPHVENRYQICKEIKSKGSLIVFPSFTYHQVTPVITGTRYSLVVWFLGRPFR